MSKAQSNIIYLSISPNLTIKFNKSKVKVKEKVCGITIYDLGNVAFATNGKVSFLVTAKNPYLV